MSKLTTEETALIEAKLHEIEEAIIAKMAASQGMTVAKMKSDIQRMPELKSYFKQVRKTVIENMYS